MCNPSFTSFHRILKFKHLLVLFLLFSVSGCSLSGYGAHSGRVAKGVYYKIKPGDTLDSIGRRYGVSPGELALLNGLVSPNQLDQGQVLLVKYSREETQKRLGSYDDEYVRSTAHSEKPRKPYKPSKEDYEDEELEAGRNWGQDNSVVAANSFRGRLSWPVAGGRLGEGFGTRSAKYHDGLDIVAPSGTPILAAHDGVVVYADDQVSGYGQLLVIRGRDGFTTVYAHCRKMFVAAGDRVTSGQKIGEVGETGKATGPHLHFEVRRKTSDNKYYAVDPLPYIAKFDPETRARPQSNLDPILVR